MKPTKSKFRSSSGKTTPFVSRQPRDPVVNVFNPDRLSKQL
ncbi:unnamed protein product [Arabidopsis lyrata]|nr:unnamed protein product [Arabidopsis lyrata]